MAQNLQGFGCRILAYSRRQNADPALGIEYCSLEELYAKSDIISLHTPLSNQTRYMIDKKAIDQMKDGVILINCARGELMRVDDIIEGIETRKIGALGLDVIEHEEGIYHMDRRSDILANRNSVSETVPECDDDAAHCVLYRGSGKKHDGRAVLSM